MDLGEFQLIEDAIEKRASEVLNKFKVELVVNFPNEQSKVEAVDPVTFNDFEEVDGFEMMEQRGRDDAINDKGCHDDHECGIKVKSKT
jgi:hypothetical protein